MAIYITTSDGTRRRFIPTGWDEELAVDAMRQSNERWLTIIDGSTSIYVQMSQVTAIEYTPEQIDPHA